MGLAAEVDKIVAGLGQFRRMGRQNLEKANVRALAEETGKSRKNQKVLRAPQ